MLRAARHARPLVSCARGPQSRTFLTSITWSPQRMKYARVLLLVGRALAVYPTFHSINDPSAPINKLFARDTTARERMYMFALSLNSPEEPLDLEQFLRGASDAAKAVVGAIHGGDFGRLEEMAVADCVSAWKQRPQQLRGVLGAQDGSTLRLDRVDVTHVGLAELKYSFSSTQNGSSDGDDSLEKSEDETTNRPLSKFLMHEEMQIKIRFEVREQFRVLDDVSSDERELAVDSSFTWAFHSDVSRADLIDWVITSATPFLSKPVE